MILVNWNHFIPIEKGVNFCKIFPRSFGSFLIVESYQQDSRNYLKSTLNVLQLFCERGNAAAEGHSTSLYRGVCSLVLRAIEIIVLVPVFVTLRGDAATLETLAENGKNRF